MKPRMRPRRPPRGFALLIVLWTTALLALIGAQVTAAGRTEARLAGNLRGSAIAEAAADAAVRESAIRLLQSPPPDQYGGARYVVRLPQAAVEVTVESEQRKLPLNTAPLAMVSALLRILGADERTALVVASQIADWRSPANYPLKNGAKGPTYKAAGRLYGPPNRPFRDLSDLRLVLSMTEPLLARLAPHVSVYTQASPKPAAADPRVLAAMKAIGPDGIQPLSFDEPPVYRVVALARAAGGGEFIRRAVIRLNSNAEGVNPTRVMDVLAWAEGPAGAAPD